jgi:hypothetical protein
VPRNEQVIALNHNQFDRINPDPCRSDVMWSEIFFEIYNDIRRAT